MTVRTTIEEYIQDVSSEYSKIGWQLINARDEYEYDHDQVTDALDAIEKCSEKIEKLLKDEANRMITS